MRARNASRDELPQLAPDGGFKSVKTQLNLRGVRRAGLRLELPPASAAAARLPDRLRKIARLQTLGRDEGLGDPDDEDRLLGVEGDDGRAVALLLDQEVHVRAGVVDGAGRIAFLEA